MKQDEAGMSTSVIAELCLLYQKRSENNLLSSFSTKTQPENSGGRSLNSLKEVEPSGRRFLNVRLHQEFWSLTSRNYHC